MSADQKPKTTTEGTVGPCEIFYAQRGAREILCALGEMAPEESVEVECAFRRRTLLQHRSGAPLVSDYDLENSFERVCFELDRRAHARRECEGRVPAPRRSVLAKSTIDATIWVLQQRDPARLREWLRKHSPAEREEIENLLRERQAKT
jgi:hypothetical protein